MISGVKAQGKDMTSAFTALVAELGRLDVIPEEGTITLTPEFSALGSSVAVRVKSEWSK